MQDENVARDYVTTLRKIEKKKAAKQRTECYQRLNYIARQHRITKLLSK